MLSSKRHQLIQGELHKRHNKYNDKFGDNRLHLHLFDEQPKQCRTQRPAEHTDKIKTNKPPSETIGHLKVEIGIENEIVQNPAGNTEKISDLVMNTAK